MAAIGYEYRSNAARLAAKALEAEYNGEPGGLMGEVIAACGTAARLEDLAEVVMEVAQGGRVDAADTYFDAAGEPAIVKYYRHDVSGDVTITFDRDDEEAVSIYAFNLGAELRVSLATPSLVDSLNALQNGCDIGEQFCGA